MTTTYDAIVIGAGPNGLVAANALGDAGWQVLVVEEQPQVGGAVRSAESTHPGFVTDLFSAFYPLAAASPVIRDLELDRYGLTWRRSPAVLAHALPDGTAAILHSDPDATAAALDDEAPGDGQAWLDLVDGWERVRDPLLDALFTPFPPIRAVSRLLRRQGVRGSLDFARLGVIPVRRLAHERFSGTHAHLLLAGNAMHSDLGPDAAGSGLFGWLLAMLGQDVGFPVPEGGAGSLAEALRRRAESRGVEFRCGTQVDQVVVTEGTAVGVVADGETVLARRAVLADVSAPALYGSMLDPRVVPPALRRDLALFHWDNPTLKINWALDRPVPWVGRGVGQAGTVHLGVDADGLVDMAADLSVGRRPRHPFVLFGQMSVADPTRSPVGTETAWAYTHVPHSVAMDGEAMADHVRRVESAIEQVAPGFGASVLARTVQNPADLHSADANLVGGAINSGTSSLHQQLVFRPTPGLGRPETPIERLYLASASAHPGGGVHGACGWNAARAALGSASPRGAVRRALTGTAWARILREPTTGLGRPPSHDARISARAGRA